MRNRVKRFCTVFLVALFVLPMVGYLLETVHAQAPLNFIAFSPSSIVTSSAPHEANLSATGSNFTNGTQSTFIWSGAVSGSNTWTRLSLGSGGVISSTPTSAETFNHIVQVRDSNSLAQTAQRVLSMTVNLAVTAPIFGDPRAPAAIAWAHQQIGQTTKPDGRTKWIGWCLRFVANAYGAPRANYEWTQRLFDTQQKNRLVKSTGMPGDLVFWSWRGTWGGEKRNWGHVGIYVGNGRVIHTPLRRGEGIHEDSISNISQRLRETDINSRFLGFAPAPQNWPGAPTVTITAPASDQTVSNATTTFNFSGLAKAPRSAVSSVQWRVNDGSWTMATGTAPWSFPVTLVVGINTVEVRAQNAQGKFGPVVRRTITRRRLRRHSLRNSFFMSRTYS